MIVEACVNGARRRGAHPRLPTTPAELAADAEAVVRAGADAIHVHPRDSDGAESLHAGAVGGAVAAMRARVHVPIGVSTGAWVVPDPAERVRAVEGWDVRPDFASVNFHEDGAREVATALLARGIGVEAGCWDAVAADALARSGIAEHCLRILVEPVVADVADALRAVTEIFDRLSGVAPGVPRLVHGHGPTAWPVLDHAAARGFDVRIGLEDTLVRPDGEAAADNAELVALARARVPR